MLFRRTWIGHIGNRNSARSTLLLIIGCLLLLTFFKLMTAEGQTPYDAANNAAKVTIYYVDCHMGDDKNSGESTDRAWRSLQRVNRSNLAPGDSLLFKRDCIWSGTLQAKWHGTPEHRIRISAYGRGRLPVIQNGPDDLQDIFHANISVTGSYLIFEYLETTIVNPPVEATCANNPIGFYVGFNFVNPQRHADTGSYNIVRYSKTTRQTVGIHLNSNTHHNRIVHNFIADNHVMHVLTPSTGTKRTEVTDDIGAWGILLKGNDNEIAFNYFTRNNAFCTFDTAPQGNSVEIYEGQHNLIHHNIAVDDRVFSELGGSVWTKADDNQFLYNLITSTIDDARFVVVRGRGSPYGPTYRTKVMHNTVYLTGTHSQALVCGAGCNDQILVAKNNIFWAEQKVAFADGAFTERRNIYWSSNGAPIVEFNGFVRHKSSLRTDPRFVDATNNNFTLRPGSPARTAGQELWWGRDIYGEIVPQAEVPNIGAVEGNRMESIPPESAFDPTNFLETMPPLAKDD